MSPRRLLFVLVLLYLGLACLYSVVTPIFEAPDEIWHYNFVREVAVHRGLPIVTPEIKQSFAHEGLQPPLYYMLGAALIAWMDPNDLGALPAPNPFVRIGEPVYATNDNRNAFLHTAEEAFPYHGAALAVHLLRLYSILLGAATVIFTYLLGRELFTHPSLPPLGKVEDVKVRRFLDEAPSTLPLLNGGGEGSNREKRIDPSLPPLGNVEDVKARRFLDEAPPTPPLKKGGQGGVDAARIALFAAAFVAFLPQFLFISSVVSNDNLATALSTASLWLVARFLNSGLTPRRAIVLGLFVGGAVLAKVSTAALVPLVLLAIVYLTLRNRTWRKGIHSGAVFILTAAIIAGWWYVRNVVIYGQLYPFAPLAALVGTRPNPLSLWRWVSSEGEGLRLSTWGVFGWFNILGSPSFYFLYDALAALGIVGLAFSLVRRENVSLRIMILPIWIGLCVAALWEYTSTIVSTQGRLLFPAISAWAILWAWGISSLVPARFRSWGMGALSAGLSLSALLTPFLFIAPAYSPNIISANQIPSVAARIDRHFDNGVVWLGAALDQTTVRPGEELTLTLYEQVPAGYSPKDAIFVHLVNSSEVIVAQRDSLIASGNMPSSQNPFVIADSFLVSIPVTVPTPDVWRVELGMYDPASGKRLMGFDQAEKTQGDVVTLETITARSPRPEAWNFDFDGQVSLVGAGLDHTSVARDNVLKLTLSWRGDPAHSDRYHAFAHALGDNDHIWASADLPVDIVHATALDLHFAPDTPPGIYPIEVGVYLAPDGDRLGVFDANGQDLGDRLFLGPVRVTP